MPGTQSLQARLASGSAGTSALAANRLILLAAIPVFLILAVFTFLTAQFAADQREDQAWVRHTYQVMEAQRRLQDDVQTAETALRGFLLSRDPLFSQGYKSYVARIPGDLAAYRDLTTDNPAQQARAARMKKLLADRIAGLEAATANTAPPAIRTDQAMAGLTRGRLQMAAIRAETNAGLQEEARLLAAREVDRAESERRMVASAVGAGVLVLGILLIAAALLVRNNVTLAAAEMARANEAAILQATLDHAPGGIAYFASDGRLCTFNRQFFQLLGLPDSLADSRCYLPQFLETNVHRAHGIFEAPAQSENAYHSRALTVGERELELYKAPVATGGFLIGVMDVTARARAEAMVRQAQKMEAIGHLTGGVAHDFNNLLQIVSANLDLAMADGSVAAGSRLAQRLENAVGAVGRGSRLTGQLLAFARRQALEPKALDLGRTIRDMSDLLRRTLGEQVQVETVIAGGLWNTLVDPNQLESAILNLAINARDAMPDGGKLTLEVANAHLDDAYAAAHDDVTPGQYVMLAVSDTGSGMSPQVMARVFEPFFTTKPEGKGTGLGLAQAYGFVKQSGGHIKLYSEPGDGTTVKIYLPRTRRARDPDDKLSSLGVQGGSERILVVEDDDGVREAVVDMLGALGYQVVAAENAQRALALLAGGAKPDLLFTDVVMPGPIPTRDFTRRAQEIHPPLKVLYTSGYTQNAIVHNGKLDDDAALLSKPYRKDDLARKLRSVLAGAARGPIAAAKADAAPAAPKGKVLVVEDVALIRMSTVDMIEQLGLETLEASDGPEALDLIKTDPQIGILLTDLGLPGMSGQELVVEARKLRPDLNVIVASGYSNAARPQGEGILSLTKPYDLNQLRKVLGV